MTPLEYKRNFYRLTKSSSRFAAFLGLTAACFFSIPAHAATAKKSNVLFILVDDLGAKDLGVTGSESYFTPKIDELAKTSSLFTQSYAASPVCSPSRAALVTGKRPSELGITDWISGWGDKGKPMSTPEVAEGLALAEETIAEHFKRAGYTTFFAGKWHLGDKGYLPTKQGFDINIGGYHKGSPPGGYYSPYKNPYLADGPEGEYLPDRLTQETIGFIEKNSKAPFFAMLSFYTVHTPIQASVKHIDMYKDLENKTAEDRPARVAEGKSYSFQVQNNPAYASMVTAMDENIGKLVESLKKQGVYDDTLIVFTSDNGGLGTSPKKHRSAPTSNYPLRAGKAWLYEGGIQVPLIVKFPQQDKQKTVASPVTSFDVFATMLDVVNSDTKKWTEGTPLTSTNAIDDNRPLFWHYPHYHRQGWTPGSAIRQGDWKLIEHFETGRTELFNLASDPSERVNLSESNPKKAMELKEAMVRWRDQVSAPMPSFKKPVNTDN